MSESIGIVFYKAFMPTLKMLMCITIGFGITKLGLLPPQSTKGVSIISMNVALPALIFSSMVSAFTLDNIVAFGPLCLMAVMYQLIGLILAWIVREIFYVPMDFRWGILVMGSMSNWGNLPTAVVQTIATEAPFNPDTDVDLGVAYIAIFILIMNTAFFPCGTHKLCAWDFREDRVIQDMPSFRIRWGTRFDTFHEKLDGMAKSCRRRRHQKKSGDGESQVGNTELVEINEPEKSIDGHTPPYQATPTLIVRRITHTDSDIHPVTSPHQSAVVLPHAVDLSTETQKPSLGRRIKNIMASTQPATYAVIIGIPTAVVPPLKALFTSTSGWTGSRMPNGPDGNPPLYIILETASFLGDFAVPSTLILLGASFARLKMPKSWHELPLAAIVAMTAIKMIIVPVFGIFVVQALEGYPTLFPPSDKIRIFVAILLSGTPAAANQLIITQLYNPEGTADTLASFLMLQYVLMAILSTALAAIALHIVS